MKNTKSEVQPIVTVPEENREPAAGIEVTSEYETGLFIAKVPEFASASPRPELGDGYGRTEGQPVADVSGMLRRWMPILVKFASVQVLVQAIGFASGILVIRNLPKPEYAFYTLCNTMLAAILVLADSGIGSALTAIGGRVWQDRKRLSQLIQTALRLRRAMALVIFPVVIPVLIWLLRHNGASMGKTAALVAIVVVGCSLELITRVYAVALRVMSQIRQIQNQALVASFVKFAIVAVALLGWLNVQVAVAAVVAGFMVQYWMLRGWSSVHLDRHAAPDAEMRREIVSVVRQQSPHSIYYCLQAQIMVWLISVFGNADRVADLGALSRLALVFTIINSLSCELVFPAFARVQSPATLRRRYLQIVLGFVAVSGSMIAVVAIFPEQVLAVLGGQYRHLHTEGVLMAVSSVLGAIAGMLWGLNTARAWIVPPMRYIPLAIALQVVLIHFLSLSTVRGVLKLSIFTMIPEVVWPIGFALLQIHKMQESAAA